MSTSYAEPKTTVNHVQAFFETHDVIHLANDAVYTDMNTGEVTKGKEAIGKMLHFMYHVAFDAKAEIINTIITGDKALLEARFTGRHIGEFAGIAPTQKQIDVPLCVSYMVNEEGYIKEGRIYMLSGVLMQQLQN